jgi:hypothetical protein
MGDVCNGTFEKTTAISIAAIIAFGYLGHEDTNSIDPICAAFCKVTKLLA